VNRCTGIHLKAIKTPRCTWLCIYKQTCTRLIYCIPIYGTMCDHPWNSCIYIYSHVIIFTVCLAVGNCGIWRFVRTYMCTHTRTHTCTHTRTYTQILKTPTGCVMTMTGCSGVPRMRLSASMLTFCFTAAETAARRSHKFTTVVFYVVKL